MASISATIPGASGFGASKHFATEIGAVQVIVRNTFVECWTREASEEESQSNIQSCPARCVGRCFLRGEDNSQLGGEVDGGPKAASSRATTYSYAGSDTGDVEVSSGSGDDEIGTRRALDDPVPFPSPPTNLLAAVPALQFTSPYGNYKLPISVAHASSQPEEVDLAIAAWDANCISHVTRTAFSEHRCRQPDVPSLQLTSAYMEGDCTPDCFSPGSETMHDERQRVVLSLSNVLASASSQAAAAPLSTRPCLAPAVSFPAPPPFAAPSVEPSLPPMPPPEYAPGALPEFGGQGVDCPPPTETSSASLGFLPSEGSAGHATGKCKPCAFFHKEGCQNGLSCSFCHLCEPGEKRKRQKERKDQKDQRIAARKSRQAARHGVSAVAAN